MYKLDTLSEINFELSTYCNSMCPQCPRYDMFGNVQKNLVLSHLNLAIIKKLPLAKMKNLEYISFIGNFGDPLMHPDLDEIIEFFQKQKILISTNASLRSKSWWQNLGKKNNIKMIFCIDGIGKTHEIYRRHTSYKKIIGNAKQFIDAGGHAEWQFIVFKHNEHQIEEAKKLSRSIGFKNIKFIYSSRFDTSDTWKVYEDNKYLYDLEISKNQKTLREKLGSPKDQKHWKKILEGKGKISCTWSKKKKIYIHSDGTVYPCCWIGSINAGDSKKQIEKILYQKIIKSFDNIDLNKFSFEEILESDTFKNKIPKSLDGHPLSHPTCIEYCNNKTGKLLFKNLNTVNIKQ